LLQAARDDSPPYGPGHGNFVNVHDAGGTEVWGVFHATDAKTGWEGRKARVMRVGWGDQGPFMGNGFCGRCCGEVEHFLGGCDGGQCGGRGPGDGHGSSTQLLKKDAKLLVGKGKRFIGKILK
jgi:hypothetical protein